MTCVRRCVIAGGLFDDAESPSIEGAFRYAISRVNNDDELLPSTKLAWDIQHVPATNSFKTGRKGACDCDVTVLHCRCMVQLSWCLYYTLRTCISPGYLAAACSKLATVVYVHGCRAVCQLCFGRKTPSCVRQS